jgi:hypothetical protein
VERADFAAAFNKRKRCHLVSIASLRFLAALLADEGFVDLNNAASAAQGRKAVRAHGFAQAVRHEPSRLIGDFQNAVKLMAADALLGTAQKVRRLKPLVQRDMRGLENRADANRELLPASAAFLQPVTDNTFGVLLARLGANALENVDLICVAAMRANRAVRPKQSLKTRKRCFFIVKVRLVENRHRRIPLT